MFRNFWSKHQSIMARYLEKRGWVVFYLDEKKRVCDEHSFGRCWLRLYEIIRKGQQNKIPDDRQIEERVV